VLTLVLFIMHGAIFMTMKTIGEHRAWILKWVIPSWIAFVALYLLATLATFFEAGFLFQDILKNPLFWVLILLLFGSVLYIPVAIKGEKFFRAFAASSLLIASVVGLAAVSLFPRLAPSSIDLAYSLTIYNACSTPGTLGAMLIIALIGMPLVIGYTIFIYGVFRGKVELSKESY